MIKATVTPSSNNLQVTIPDNYIGKEIEVLLYSRDELSTQHIAKIKNASRFKGILTNEEADKYLAYLKQARTEWDRDL